MTRKGPGQVVMGPQQPRPPVQDHIPAAPPRTSREHCLVNWPDAESMAYHPSCCRFPKSCSIDPPEREDVAIRSAEKDPESAARDLLLHWALPLLARARRVADECAEGQALSIRRETFAELAQDIVDLIGHGVTDVPPADELDALLVDAPAITSHLPGRRGTREFYEAVTAAPRPCYPPAKRHSLHPDPLMRIRQGFDEGGHPPNCSNYREVPGDRREQAHAQVVHGPYTADAVPETPTKVCTCGARPGQGHQILCAVWA